MLEAELGVGRAEVLAVMKEIHQRAGAGIREDLLRHAVKRHFKSRVHAALLKGTAEESYHALRRMTDNLAPADKGALAEYWYRQHYARDAKAHVGISKDDLAKAGVALDTDRVADLIDGSGIIEIKSGANGLSPRDLKQIEDFQKLRDHRASVGSEAAGTRTQIKTVTVVFTNPEGAFKGLKQLRRHIDQGTVRVECFDSRGVRHQVADRMTLDRAVSSLSSKE